MTQDQDFEIFLATAPGLEPVLAEEVRTKGFKRPHILPGGVTTRGRWPEVWRANLWIRGATRVLARIASFHVTHLAHLDAQGNVTRVEEFLTGLRDDANQRFLDRPAEVHVLRDGSMLVSGEQMGAIYRITYSR